MSLSPAQQSLQNFSKLAAAKTWTERDELVEKMQQLYTKLTPDSTEAIVLGFALAKIHDDLGEYDEAFQLLSECNSNHRRNKTDTIEDVRDTIAAVKQLFTDQQVQPLFESTYYQPFFIVGLPRSGTSLVEQILATHSKVVGGGELKLIGQWSFGFLKLYSSNQELVELNNYLPELRAHYVNGLKTLTGNKYVTDKMPVNFLWLGFIAAAFPRAKIIHTVRDPMATCWSMYKTAFVGTSNGYACDLADIGEFYMLYADLMAFWRERIPGIYDLDYEALTIAPETQARALLEYCELPWEPGVMEFHNNTREVQTASWADVKRPIYRGSSAAWKNYEKYLGPLKSRLAPD